MAEIDKEYIRDLIAKGNRFEAMNIFIQSKFGKPEHTDSSIKIKREVGEPVTKAKKNKIVDSTCKGNSESESEGSDGGSDSESSSSHGSTSVPRSEALVPEVELKEDELDVDIETVDPMCDVLLPRPHVVEQTGDPTHIPHPQQNLQGTIYCY